MRDRSLVLLALAGLMVAAPAAAHQAAPAAPPRDAALSATPRLPVIRPAPDFALLDPEGRRVRLAKLRGRVALVAFIHTRCTAACPLLTARMARLQATLGADRERVRLLSTGHGMRRSGRASRT